LDGPESSVGEGSGEVLGFLRKPGDEGVQPEWIDKDFRGDDVWMTGLYRKLAA